MNEKRFTSNKRWIAEGTIVDICDNGKVIMQVFDNDNIQNVVDFLNEQQAIIDEQKIIIEERDVANERLNRFLIEIGLEKEYIKWEFKKRCVE